MLTPRRCLIIDAIVLIFYAVVFGTADEGSVSVYRVIWPSFAPASEDAVRFQLTAWCMGWGVAFLLMAVFCTDVEFSRGCCWMVVFGCVGEIMQDFSIGSDASALDSKLGPANSSYLQFFLATDILISFFLMLFNAFATGHKECHSDLVVSGLQRTGDVDNDLTGLQEPLLA